MCLLHAHAWRLRAATAGRDLRVRPEGRDCASATVGATSGGSWRMRRRGTHPSRTSSPLLTRRRAAALSAPFPAPPSLTRSGFGRGPDPPGPTRSALTLRGGLKPPRPCRGRREPGVGDQRPARHQARRRLVSGRAKSPIARVPTEPSASRGPNDARRRRGGRAGAARPALPGGSPPHTRRRPGGGGEEEVEGQRRRIIAAAFARRRGQRRGTVAVE